MRYPHAARWKCRLCRCSVLLCSLPDQPDAVPVVHSMVMARPICTGLHSQAGRFWLRTETHSLLQICMQCTSA